MFFTKKLKNDSLNLREGGIYTDFHSHVLPCVDDGSRSVEESLRMLAESRSQGVRRIVATPHFYPRIHKPEDFLEKRRVAVETLASAMTQNAACKEDYPDLYVGAEVAYFSGISRCDWMKKMCISGSRILLVEMPFERWSVKMLEELFEMKNSLGIVPVIAHLDRYFSYQSRELIDELFVEELLIQCNAESFSDGKTRKKVLKMLKEGKIDFIGSDCHGDTVRAPNMGEAYKVISGKLGEDAVNKLNEFGDFVFSEISPIC